MVISIDPYWICLMARKVSSSAIEGSCEAGLAKDRGGKECWLMANINNLYRFSNVMLSSDPGKSFLFFFPVLSKCLLFMNPPAVQADPPNSPERFKAIQMLLF